MNDDKPVARSMIVTNPDWRKAVLEVLARMHHVSSDLVIVFVQGCFARHFSDIVRAIYAGTNASVLIGCSGQGVIGIGTELEDCPSLVLLALSLPGAVIRTVYFPPLLLEECECSSDWYARIGITPEEVNAWLLFADPFHMDCEHFVARLAKAYPTAPVVGGLASGDLTEQRTYLFLNDQIYDAGAVGLALGGAYTLFPVVSQGCEPIGEPWTITSVSEHGLIETISNRPAYDVLIETFDKLPPGYQRRILRNLFVGLAADEYCTSFERGSFMIRSLLGVELHSGALAIGAYPRIGQTVQFQMRDAAIADLDLKEGLAWARRTLVERSPLAGVLCSCNGRGVGMFGMPDHDAGLIAHELGPIPLAGLFCNGEIGPIGKYPAIHGFTASLALIVPQKKRGA